MTLNIQNRVGSLAHREPVIVAPDETLRNVAHTLWVESVGALVVGDAHDPRGVISERDVVALLAQGADADAMTAEEAMTSYVISARSTDPLYDVAAQMLDGEIRHIPVVDENDKVVGMVSVRDLLRPLLLDALGG